MKLSASKFNEKTFLGNSKKKIKKSQMSAVRTGVRAYMDATPLNYEDENIASFRGVTRSVKHFPE